MEFLEHQVKHRNLTPTFHWMDQVGSIILGARSLGCF